MSGGTFVIISMYIFWLPYIKSILAITRSTAFCCASEISPSAMMVPLYV